MSDSGRPNLGHLVGRQVRLTGEAWDGATYPSRWSVHTIVRIDDNGIPRIHHEGHNWLVILPDTKESPAMRRDWSAVLTEPSDAVARLQKWARDVAQLLAVEGQRWTEELEALRVIENDLDLEAQR